jgi:uncharacterized repeat protein (TIGR01451 family)
MVLGLFAQAAFADIAVTDRGSTLRAIAQRITPDTRSPADKAAAKAAAKAENDKKKADKRARHPHSGKSASSSPFRLTTTATGSVALVDAGGLKYFINTNITFSTSSSASGAASEASYTHAIAASTSAGGVVSSTLNDMFDGYNALCVSLTNSTGPCSTFNPNFVMYNQNGPAAVDTTVPAVPECTNRQFVFPAKNIAGLSVSRKVYVPTNDRYIRWMNFFTNTTASPITFTMIVSNNLGSDSNTRVVTTSSGDAIVTTGDLWATSFQNYSGNFSTDPRIGHVFQGSGAPTPVSNITFVDGDDNPFWSYSITLNPGQTKMIANYATGQGTKAAAAAQAANLAAFGANAQQCMSATELSEVANFVAGGSADLTISKTANVANPDNAFSGGPVNYTLAVTNNGPTSATSVSVSDPLPAGSGFVSATGAGWTCGFSAGVVTCTMPSLAVGPAAPITLIITAPHVTRPTFVSNTATVSSATSDPVPGNNSSTATVKVVPGHGPGH